LSLGKSLPLKNDVRDRAGFRHVQEVQLHRAPTNEGPCAKAYSDKGFPRQKGFNALGASPLESGPLEYDPIE
jgi:hypothetical protein